MFRAKGPILAAIDLNKESHEAIRQADALARSHKAKLTVCHVFPEIFADRPLHPQLHLDDALRSELAPSIKRKGRTCDSTKHFTGQDPGNTGWFGLFLVFDFRAAYLDAWGQLLSRRVQELVDEHVLSGGRRCFLVNRGSDTIGLITLHRIRTVPRDEWQTTRVAQAMLPLDKLTRVRPDDELWAALQQMDRDGMNQLPVMTDNNVVGMLSREDVISFLRTVRELAS